MQPKIIILSVVLFLGLVVSHSFAAGVRSEDAKDEGPISVSAVFPSSKTSTGIRAGKVLYTASYSSVRGPKKFSLVPKKTTMDAVPLPALEDINIVSTPVA